MCAIAPQALDLISCSVTHRRCAGCSVRIHSNCFGSMPARRRPGAWGGLGGPREQRLALRDNAAQRRAIGQAVAWPSATGQLGVEPTFQILGENLTMEFREYGQFQVVRPDAREDRATSMEPARSGLSAHRHLCAALRMTS